MTYRSTKKRLSGYASLPLPHPAGTGRLGLQLVFSMSCLLFPLISATGATDSLTLAAIRKHFEWGEYADLITKTEPLSLSFTAREDAVLCVYLGVAYFASGRVEDARVSFIRAYDLDDGAAIDSYYVSSEIIEFFHATLNQEKERREAQAENDSLIRVRVMEQKLSQARLALQENLAAQRRMYVGIGTLSLTASVLFAGFTAYEYVVSEPAYDDFLLAAENGDLASYRVLKQELDRSNIMQLVAGSVSAVCVVSGAYFIFRSRAVTRRMKTVVVSYKGANGNPAYGISVHTSF